MTAELQILVWVAVLCVLQAFPYILVMLVRIGPVRGMSYPAPTDDVLPEWAKRSKRAHLNLVENIGPFAAVVLVAHAAGVSNETTVLGAQLFFWARIAMVAGHTAAIPGVRSVAWFVSLAGLFLIAGQLF